MDQTFERTNEGRERMALHGEAQLSLVLDAAPDAIVVVDDRGRVRLVTRQAELLFGYCRDELLGAGFELLVPERSRGVHAVHVDRFFERPATRSMGSRLELFGRRKDGSEVPIEVSLSPLPMSEGVFVTAAIRDISERKQLEARARQAAARLEVAVEAIQDAIALFDERDELVLCNSAYRTLLAPALPETCEGIAFDAILDAWLDALEFTDPLAREQFVNRRRSRRRSGAEAESDVRTRDGKHLRITDRLTADGGVVETVWDLTGDARIADALREARTAAEAASAAKSEFLSSMSHELRTPLNAILGFSQLLRGDKALPLPDKHRERVNHILRGGEHLLRLINDVLDLSRIEAGGLSISLEPVDVLEVLEELRATLAPTAADAGVSLEVVAASSEVPMIEADRTRFLQILMNFGSNAIKYNRRHGKAVLTVSQPDAEYVRISVSDTGIGIPLDKQASLFQPFQRAGQETGAIEGTGIGLAITKRLVELMKGRVDFQSAPGVGSQFWVDMPVHPSRKRSSTPPSVRVVQAPSLGWSETALVLYIEDNAANVTFMQDFLGTLDCVELLVAQSAEEGLDLARTMRPSAILMDINLPGLNGHEALARLRTWPETAAIPVIALTAAASERDKKKGLAAGFHRYLTKPLQLAELEALLRMVLGRPDDC